MSPLEWLTSGCWLLFGSLPIIALATIVGLLKSVSTASAVNNMILMPLAILSGLWWPIENFPKLLQHFAQWLPTYHAAEGAKQLAAGELPTAKGSLIIFGSFLGIMVLSIYLNKQKEEVLR